MQEIKSIEALIELLKTREITQCAFQSLDLTGVTDLVKNVRFKHCLFLGCTFDDDFLLKNLSCYLVINFYLSFVIKCTIYSFFF